MIDNSIDEVTTLLINSPDLATDVLPFLMPALVKLKRLSNFMADRGRGEFESAYYEFNQLCTMYLPSTVKSYCQLPLEFRNTRVFKDGKTARELLITDLQKLIDRIWAIEDSLLSKDQREFLVNHTFLNNKFTDLGELSQFNNSFDYEAWSKTQNGANAYQTSSGGHNIGSVDRAGSGTGHGKIIPPKPSVSEKMMLSLNEKKTKIGKFLHLAVNQIKTHMATMIGVSVVAGVGYGVSLPGRYLNNVDDIGSNIEYLVSVVEQKKTFTKPELDKIVERMRDFHAEKVGDFFPLTKAAVDKDNNVILSYQIDGEHSCANIIEALQKAFSYHNVQAAFYIDSVEYATYQIDNKNTYLSLDKYVNSYAYKASLLTQHKKILDKLNGSILGMQSLEPQYLEKNPVVLPIPTSGIFEHRACSLGKTNIEIKVRPNALVPEFKTSNIQLKI